jgi:hypothetical protein
MKNIFTLLLCALSVFIEAQNSNRLDNCLSHSKSLYNWQEIENRFSKQLRITPAQSKAFFRYAAKWSYLKMNDYLQLVKDGSINKDNAQQYWLNKLPYMESLYITNYLPALEKEKLEASRNLLKGSYKITGSSCNNLDFSSGDLSNWTGQWNNQGTSGDTIVEGSIQGYGNLTVNGFNSSPGEFNQMGYVHELCNGGTDPILPINRIPPGHSYSLRLGNDSAYDNIFRDTSAIDAPNPFNHQTISNTFTVTSASQTITYWYAVVLSQYNPNNHSSNNQPYFKVSMYDSSGAEIKCASFNVNALTAQDIGGFNTIPMQIPGGSGTGTTIEYDLIYKDWSSVSIGLSPFLGQSVTIKFETSDCGGGAHFSYAYLAVDCNTNKITTLGALCNGSNAILSGPLGMVTYNWTGPVTGTSQDLLTNVPGNYTLTTTSGAGCTTSPLYYTLTQSSAIPPTISINSTRDSVCAGVTAILTASGANTYTWNNTATGYSFSVSPENNTTYTVTGIDTTTGCANTALKTITITAITPTISIQAIKDSICNGISTILTASGANTYVWNTGATTNSVTVFPKNTIAYTVTGTDTITGCTNAGLQTVYVTQTNASVISVQATKDSICSGTATSLTANGSASTYTWSTGANSNSISVSPINNTTYTVSGTDASTGCIYMATKAIYINTVLMFTQVNRGMPMCIGDTVTITIIGGNNTYTWSTGSTAHTIKVSPVVDTTTLSLIGTDITTGCTDTIKGYILAMNCTAAGIQTLNATNDALVVYPNPANETLTITDLLPNTPLFISDLLGNKVKQLSIETELIPINISDLSNGVYFLNVQSIDGMYTKKIIVQH